MRHPNFLPACVALTALAGCTLDSGIAGDEKDDCAGPTLSLEQEDFAVTSGDTVTLAATGAVCTEGGDITWNWNMETVPTDSKVDNSYLATTDPAKPYFQTDKPGTYVVSVYISDPSTGESSDTLYAVVVATSGNSAPTADCGGNVEGEIGVRSDLDGSGSSDPENAALTYDWVMSSWPSCSAMDTSSIFNGATSMASVVPDCEGVFVVSLVVSDGENYSDPDYCSVTVDSDDDPPVADAGDSQSLPACTDDDFQLDGYGSYDPEGAELTYLWTLLSYPTDFDPAASGNGFNDPTEAAPYFHWDNVLGEYTFQLQVNDGVNDSPPDLVTYVFQDSDENNRPSANAGEDQSVDDTVDCTTASYTWTCEDCPSQTLELDGTGSTDEDGDDINFFWSEATNELTIQAPASPVTDVVTPSYPLDYSTPISKSWTVNLNVADCVDDDDDDVTVTYTCTGEYDH